jgi:hypothetical protein
MSFKSVDAGFAEMSNQFLSNGDNGKIIRLEGTPSAISTPGPLVSVLQRTVYRAISTRDPVQ